MVSGSAKMMAGRFIGVALRGRQRVSVVRMSDRAGSERWGGRDARWILALITLAAGSFLAFVFAPWPLQDKALAALHGLCAQQPTHSFWIGETRLPFDARMTGIYGGCLLMQGYLLLRGRLYRFGLPPASLLVGMGAAVVIMGFDGVNSFLNDVGLPYLYEPSNHLRYFTGALMGTTLAVFLWLLMAGTVWSPERASPRPLVRGWKELAPVAALVVVFWAVIQAGLIFLFAPLALLLILAAVLVLSMLALTAIQLAAGGFQRATRPADLAGPAILAMLLAFAFMGAIGGGRFWLESAVGM
jgi:uncharacterized membrane protein